MKLIGNLVACVGITAAFFVLSSAQQRNDSSGQAGRERVMSAYEMRERERLMRERTNNQDVMGVFGQMASDSDPAAAAPRLPIAQISQNLTRLQAANSFLTVHGAQNGVFNFREVARGASQLKKSAVKLRDDLALPDGEEDAPPREVAADPARLRAALTSLSSLVGEFVRNPVLRGEVIEAESSAKARRDLDRIIRLSEAVKRSSEKAGKIYERSDDEKKANKK